MATSSDDLTFPIFKFLCAEGSKGLNIYSIVENVSHSSNDLHLNLPSVRRLIKDKPEYFHQEQGIIYPKTLLRLCGFPITHDDECTSLHICKFYLLSNSCTYKHKCVYGHNFESNHNVKILKKHQLHDLNFEEVRGLLLARCNRTPETTPSVCVFYNREDGCRKSTNCNCIHICNKFLDSKCQSRNCDKNHNVQDRQVVQVLEKYGFETSLDEEIVELMKSISELDIDNIDAPPSVPSKLKHKNETSEFCHYFSKGGCLRRDCKFIHSKKLYLWRYFENQWHPFPDKINEQLENDYCDPNLKDIQLSEPFKNICKVDFEKMIGSKSNGDFLKIERIQASSNKNWIWYWKPNQTTWEEMCQSGIEEKNEVIQKHFTSMRNIKLHFIQSNTYAELNFENMELSHNSILYPVCRRPKLIE